MISSARTSAPCDRARDTNSASSSLGQGAAAQDEPHCGSTTTHPSSPPCSAKKSAQAARSDAASPSRKTCGAG